jgi:phosphoglycerate dehydrogenase-like enzyme
MANVMLTWYARADEIARVKASLPRGTVVFAPKTKPHLSRFEVGYDDLIKAAPKADAIMGWVVPPGIWAAAKNLKALAWLHAGCDELDFAMLKRRGIKVANIRGGNGIAVAEHAMALLMGIAKRLAQRHQWVQEAKWQPFWQPEAIGTLLEGKTLAVIGLGQIGSAVARRAKAFDMHVIGVRRHMKLGGSYVDEVYGPEKLHTVLKRADFVLLSAPLTGETLHMIDAKALAAMKPTAFLVNIARGNMIVEQALYEALTKKRLAGYAADVWWNYTNSFPATYHYPVVSRTGLHRLPNVLCSGDQASNADGMTEREIVMGTESLAAFFARKPMPREVDLDLGY